MQVHSPTPGPATVSYYEVPRELRHLPNLNFPGKFRFELSQAFSRVYHLLPHAIIISYLEGRPIGSYFDEEAYALSRSFYDDPHSPGSDALNTKAAILACRHLYALNQLPRPNDVTHQGKTFITEQHMIKMFLLLYNFYVRKFVDLSETKSLIYMIDLVLLKCSVLSQQIGLV